jgi:hypothetical protein
VAVLLDLIFDPRSVPTDFEFGLAYTAMRYDQSLPLIGIAVALGRAPLRLCILGMILFAVGIPVGGVVADGFAAIASTRPSMIGYIFLVGPACCVLVGMGLAAPPEIARWVAPPVALIMGSALGLVIDFGDSTKWPFPAGAILAGLWIAIATLLSSRAFERPWLVVASRILGSWLIAIGAMLFAAQLIPRPPS